MSGMIMRLETLKVSIVNHVPGWAGKTFRVMLWMGNCLRWSLPKWNKKPGSFQGTRLSNFYSVG